MPTRRRGSDDAKHASGRQASTQSVSPSLSPTGRRNGILIGIGLGLLTFLVFSRALFNDFIEEYDDDAYVVRNTNVQAGLTLSSLKYALTGECVANWHPVTMLSHILDVQFFGLHPWGHHLINIMLHAVNAALLFWLLRVMAGSQWRSIMVAALFALHPLHVESAVVVAQRKDLLSTLFWLLALLAYRRYSVRAKGMGWVLLWFVLSLLSKPMAVTCPVILLLLDYWPLKRITFLDSNRSQIARDIRKLVLEKWPFAVVSVLMSLVAIVVQNRGGALTGLDQISLAMRTANALTAYVAYIRMTLWPSGLAAFYPYATSYPLWETLGRAAFLILVTGLAVLQAKRHPHMIVGWLWFLVTLIPVIGVVQVSIQSMADRYTYVPLIGLFIAMVWSMADFVAVSRVPRPVVAVAAAAIPAVLIPCTWVQIGYWQNAETMWNRALAVTSDNYPAHINLQVLLAKKGRPDEALVHALECVRILPGADQMVNLAINLRQVGRDPEARTYLLRARDLAPDNGRVYGVLGQYYIDHKEYDEADKNFAQLQAPSAYLEVFFGNQFLRAACLDRAEAHFRKALEIDRGYAPAYSSYGRLLERTGRLEEALHAYSMARKIDPGLAGLASKIRDIKAKGFSSAPGD